MTTYCYPVPHGKQNFESREKAEEHIKKHGGQLTRVPTFDTKAGVDQWIQTRSNPNDWARACCNNVIGVDQNGNPLEDQEYKPQKPGEPLKFAKDLGKPDFEYFV